MKYCLKCGEIVADNSMFKDMNDCMNCNISFQEDNMTGEMFGSLSDNEKQQYADKLLKRIMDSDIFDKESFKKHHEGANLYQCWWFDKYEELGGKFSARYETNEQRKQRLDREYGKNSPAYQQAVVEQCIQTDRDRKSENQVKCAYCNSTNVKKISVTSKVVNTALFGIFGTKRHKQWHCNSCDSDF